MAQRWMQPTYDAPTAPPAAASSSARPAHPDLHAPMTQHQNQYPPPQQPPAMHPPHPPDMRPRHSPPPQPPMPAAHPRSHGTNQRAAPTYRVNIEYSNVRAEPRPPSLAGPQHQRTPNQMHPPSGSSDLRRQRPQNRNNPSTTRPEPQRRKRRRLLPTSAATVRSEAHPAASSSSANSAPGTLPPAAPAGELPVDGPAERLSVTTPVPRRLTPGQRLGSYGQRYVPSPESMGSSWLSADGDEDPTVSGYSSRAGADAEGGESEGDQKTD